MFPRFNVISITSVIGTAHHPLRVLSANYEEYILKHPSSATPEYCIISEFLCSALLHYWDLKTPDAAILLVNTNIVDFNYTGYHPHQRFIRPCFGSKVINSATEFTNFNTRKLKFFNKLASPLDFFKLSIFDLWVQNIDRKPANSNLLLHNTGAGLDFVAIDHAYTFSRRSFAELHHTDGVTLSETDSLLNSEFAKQLKDVIYYEMPNWLDNLQDAFYLCIEKCKKHFESILNAIPLELGLTRADTVSLGQFLFSNERNRLVLSDFYRRLKP